MKFIFTHTIWKGY